MQCLRMKKNVPLWKWAHLRKQADAQSGVLLRSRCTQRLGWLCLHCSLRCFHKGLPASFLVYAKSLRTNERMERNEVQRNEWMRELSFCYHFGRSFSWNTRNVERGSGTKYGWSERLFKNPFIKPDFSRIGSPYAGFCKTHTQTKTRTKNKTK